MTKSRHRGRVLCWLVFAVVTMQMACGFERLEPVPTDQIAGFSLDRLEEIQDDETLTDNERREAIREAVGAPNDADGDRLVEFLLTFNVP